MTSNKRRRHTPDQIIRKLAEGNKLLASGQELDAVCRHLEVAESTWHRWLAQYGGMKANYATLLSSIKAGDYVLMADTTGSYQDWSGSPATVYFSTTRRVPSPASPG